MTARKPHRRASSGPVTVASPAAATAPSPATAQRPAAEAGTEAAGQKPASAADRDGASRRSPESRSPATGASVLRVKAADDDPRVWGDSPENGDSWLLEQRPPHWD